MTFKDWIYSRYPNPAEQNQWGILHISVLVICIAIMIAMALTLRKSHSKSKIAIYVLTGIIFVFEIARRIINATRPLFYGGEVGNFLAWIRLIVPRPWCAISCWLIIASAIFRKKFLYNIASMCAFICALIFFAYPEAGFNNEYMLFENVYSITTHSLLLITSVSLITLKHADFRYVRGEKWTNTALVELICLACVFLYAALEIIFNVEADPLYFMPANDIMEIVGLSYPVFLIVYIAFLGLYFNLFYLVPIWWQKLKKPKVKAD